jgi:hypothetical protein
MFQRIMLPPSFILEVCRINFASKLLESCHGDSVKSVNEKKQVVATGKKLTYKLQHSRYKQCVPLKSQYPPANLHGIITIRQSHIHCY